MHIVPALLGLTVRELSSDDRLLLTHSIGKGGMGAKTLAGLKQHGAVYLNAIGGAAQYYSECVKSVDGVHWLDEFGIPEAMWHLRVNGFATICTMDSHGNSLHKEVDASSLQQLGQFAQPVFADH